MLPDLLQSYGPPVLLVLTLGAAGWGVAQRPPGSHLGYAVATRYPVAAPDDGVMERLDVATGDLVIAGAALGALGSELRVARWQVLAAKRVQLEAAAAAGTVPAETVAAELAVVEQELLAEAQRIARMTLTAPAAGRVAELGVRAGAYVREGEAVLSIVPDSVHSVVVCVPAELLIQVGVGDEARLDGRDGQPPRIGTVSSTAVGNDADSRCRSRRSGQPASLGVLVVEPLVPGQVLDVRFPGG